jgi:hypothetical protein
MTLAITKNPRQGLITSVVDTSELIAGVNNTGEQLNAGVNNTGEQLIASVNDNRDKIPLQISPQIFLQNLKRPQREYSWDRVLSCWVNHSAI